MPLPFRLYARRAKKEGACYARVITCYGVVGEEDTERNETRNGRYNVVLVRVIPICTVYAKVLLVLRMGQEKDRERSEITEVDAKEKLKQH